MKNTFKKIGALVLVLVMMAAMSVTAFAADADMTGEAGVIGEFTEDNPAVQDDAVIIYKEITALNPEDCTVNAPTITYTYAISAGDAGKSITDASSHHKKIDNTDVNVTVTTKAGVGSPVITGTTSSNSTAGNSALYITPADQLDASEYGTANRFPIAIDFSSINWASDGSGAGVYRYVITETCLEETKNAAGIAEGSVANTLYMDVYVDGSGNIYGYVLFTNNDDINASPDADAAAATAAGKTEGFVGSEADGEDYSADNSAADKYYTFNFGVSKEVVNDAYAIATNHEFPFDITLANSEVTANVLPKITFSGTHTGTVPTAAAGIAGFSYDGTADTPTNPLKLAHQASVTFVGVPCGTTVTIKEKNDVTGVTYNSVSENAHDDAAAKPIGTGEVSNNATITCTAHITRATENHNGILFTNTLLQISPTGVVMRVAPYVLILAAGIVLVIISRRRRSEEEA